MLTCNLCFLDLEEPVYVSAHDVSITSLCEIVPGQREVYFCERCGHLQTTRLGNLDAYYDRQYRILLDSEEEDQLYKVEGDCRIYRYDHQADTLLAKVSLRQNALVLDYGCAKGATMRKLKQRRPDVVPHLFDVSEMYVPFWGKFADPQNWATYAPRGTWRERFDLITSFFTLEHVVDPRAMMATTRGLLKPGGIFYGIVPNVLANIADFIVADHVNHFTGPSLRKLLRETGFSAIEIDDRAHDSALVVQAVNARCDAGGADGDFIAAIAERVNETADYWTSFASKVQAFEAAHQNAREVAIYGSGFYGTFIASCLQDLGKVRFFLDRNPYRQGKTSLDQPIIRPEDLPAHIDVVYVGLNPVRARAEIDKVAAWRNRTLDCFYP